MRQTANAWPLRSLLQAARRIGKDESAARRTATRRSRSKWTGLAHESDELRRLTAEFDKKVMDPIGARWQRFGL